MEPGNVMSWGSDWAWGLPLIVLTVVSTRMDSDSLRGESKQGSAAPERREISQVFLSS
jgi:hypothetical protein